MMLETLKGLLDAAKATTYELLALLLPGGVVLSVLEHSTDVAIPFGTIGPIAAAYIFGTVLQAIADFLLKREWVKKRLHGETSTWKTAHDYALGLIQRKLSAAPSDVTLDVCLTSIGAHRVVYDKFVALRDTARGLAFATLIAAVLLIVEEWSTLTIGPWWSATARIGGAIALASGAFLAFIQRYARFHPLALQAVYGQFIATQLGAKD